MFSCTPAASTVPRSRCFLLESFRRRAGFLPRRCSSRRISSTSCEQTVSAASHPGVSRQSATVVMRTGFFQVSKFGSVPLSNLARDTRAWGAAFSVTSCTVAMGDRVGKRRARSCYTLYTTSDHTNDKGLAVGLFGTLSHLRKRVRKLRPPGLEPGTKAWKASMLTPTPRTPAGAHHCKHQSSSSPNCL